MILGKSRSLLFCILFLALSCFSGAKKNLELVKRCQVNLDSVSIKKTSGNGLFPKLEIIPWIEVKNPNPEDVEIVEFDLTLRLVLGKDKENLGKIRNEESQIVKAGESKRIPLQLEVDAEEALESKIIALGIRLIAASSRGEETEFEIDGYLYLDSGFGKVPIPVQETKKLRIK